MPRYHFHAVDDGYDPDLDGTELADDQAAQEQAVRFAGEMLQSAPPRLWTTGQWRVEVTDEAGALLFVIVILALQAPDREKLGAAAGAP